MLPLPPLPPGTCVDDLVVEELVDAGGYGSVFRARSPSSGMLFALKFIPLSRGWEWVKRELVIMLHLEHKNLVSLVGSGFWPPALPEFFFLKMEYVKGRHLDVWAWEENPDAWTIAGKVLGVARGLAVAHAQDVVHRDVKEANILVRDSDGEPVVLDFGAARREPQTTLTEGLFPPGTPLYRSPEAWRFGLENERKVRVHYRPGKADDLYAVGVVLYRLLTGRSPFVLTEDEESVRAVIDKPPLPPSIVNPRVPRTLGDVCMRLLEKRPEDRYPGAVALCEVLEELRARADDSWRVPLRDSRPPPVRRLALQVSRRAVVRVGLLMGLVLAASSTTSPTSQGTFRQEVAASRPSPEAERAAVPPPVVSTPAAVASPATRPKDNAVVKKKQKTPSRLGQEVELLRAAHGPGGLRGMIAAGLLMLGDATGVVAKVLTKGLTRPVDNALFPDKVTSYRSKTTQMEGKPAVVRVAVAMRVINPGPQPWTVKAAALVGKGKEAKRVEVWQPAPLQPNEPGLVVVETELLEGEVRGTFTLELWEEGGGRRVTLGGVTFP